MDVVVFPMLIMGCKRNIVLNHQPRHEESRNIGWISFNKAHHLRPNLKFELQSINRGRSYGLDFFWALKPIKV